MPKATTEAVWQRLSADLLRFLRRRVPDEHLADDLLQETFLRIHRSLGTLAAEDRLAAWVYRIARNVVRDHYRRSAAEAVNIGDADRGEEPPSPLTGQRGSAAAWMDELIDQLPAPYRQAVRLAEIDGLSQQQVADLLGLSLSGAKSRIQRGRKLLKKVLDQCCAFAFDRRGNLLDVAPKPGRTVCRDCGDADPRASCR
jgi:RNA polymerase sigma-70 factor (ECF subfamily)